MYIPMNIFDIDGLSLSPLLFWIILMLLIMLVKVKAAM